MKSTYVIFLALVVFFASCKHTETTKNKETTVITIDTIQTKSGLRYYYVKHGKGVKVESGDEVSTYLSLMVNDTVVWNSNTQPDSLYTFTANKSRVIRGFNEMVMLLREGDEVVAILPDSLAYGADGAGKVIPPYATLVYDQFKIVKVVKPIKKEVAKKATK